MAGIRHCDLRNNDEGAGGAPLALLDYFGLKQQVRALISWAGGLRGSVWHAVPRSSGLRYTSCELSGGFQFASCWVHQGNRANAYGRSCTLGRTAENLTQFNEL